MERKDVEAYIAEGVEARKGLDADQLVRVGKVLSNAFKDGKKLILMGNGGSAADAQHIAAEFVGRFEKERDPLPAIALHTNTSSVTAISNDYSYGELYARQVAAFAESGDVVVGISTSGNSENVVKGLKAARELGCYCISLTGSGGGKVADFSDEVIAVKSKRTSIIQEVHIAIGHILSKIVEDSVF